MCPPNRIVLNVASEIIERLKQQDNKKIKDTLAKYSKKYILYFKTINPEQFSDKNFIETIPQKAPKDSKFLGVVVFVPEHGIVSEYGTKPEHYRKLYPLSLIGATDIWLRHKTIELNNDICLNITLYMKRYKLDDKNIYYFCMFLKKGAKMDLTLWEKRYFIDVKPFEKKNLKRKREK